MIIFLPRDQLSRSIRKGNSVQIIKFIINKLIQHSVHLTSLELNIIICNFVRDNNVEAVKLIIEKNNEYFKNIMDWNLLLANICTLNTHYEIVELLIKNGADDLDSMLRIALQHNDNQEAISAIVRYKQLQQEVEEQEQKQEQEKQEKQEPKQEQEKQEKQEPKQEQEKQEKQEPKQEPKQEQKQEQEEHEE